MLQHLADILDLARRGTANLIKQLSDLFPMGAESPGRQSFLFGFHRDAGGPAAFSLRYDVKFRIVCFRLRGSSGLIETLGENLATVPFPVVF